MASTDSTSIPVRKRQNFAPLSLTQEGLWVLSQFNLQKGIYNRPVVLHLKGVLSAVLLQEAVSDVIRKHEVLRCRIRSDFSQPVQQIEKPKKVDLGYLDFSEMPQSEREIAAQQFIHMEVNKPVDLSSSPLLRASLVRLAEDEYILILVFHHICFDAWSERVLLADLSLAYNGLVNGKSPDLEELKIQYADFAAWQRERLEAGQLDQHVDYWKRKLADMPPAFELPSDFHRPPIYITRGAEIPFELPFRTVNALRSLAQSENATLYMVSLSAFLTLLYRYTGEQDVMIGSPIAGRTVVETEDLIGLFINTLVLRFEITGSQTFQELLQHVRTETLDAYSNQEIPLEKLVEVIPYQRDLSRTPFFQILFNFENIPEQQVSFSGMQVEVYPINQSYSRYDLSLELTQVGDTLKGTAVYNTELYRQETIQSLLDCYVTLLDHIVENPNQRIDKISILSQSVIDQIVYRWNQTHVPDHNEKGIAQVFEEQVRLEPEKVAVETETQSISYQQLNESANSLARYLNKRGVPRSTLVGVLLERSPELIIAVLAVLKSGRPFLLLDPSQPKLRLNAIAHNANLTSLITDHEKNAEVGLETNFTLLIDQEALEIQQCESGNLDFSIKGNSPAYVIYTSGSTGEPKGVVVSHKSLSNHASMAKRLFDLKPKDVFIQSTSISFDVALAEIFDALLNGARLALLSSGSESDVEALVEAIFRHQVSILNITPAHLQMLVDTKRFAQCIALRHVLCGGEMMPPELTRDFYARSSAVLHNLYGPAESCIDSTHYLCESPLSGEQVPIGRPVENTQVYILDEYLQPVPVGVRGELYIGGEGLAIGYFNQPIWTAEKFLPNPFAPTPGDRFFRTGDLASFLPDGTIRFHGRTDRQIKIRGMRIELGEIEETLNALPGIKKSVVILSPRIDKSSEVLIAYIVSDPDALLSVRSLRNTLRSKLPENMIPTVYQFIDSIPLTSSGKIDLNALLTINTEILPQEKPILPRTALERLVASVWADVLHLKQVDLQDHFFDVGGHSLLAIRLIARLNNLLETEIPFGMLIESPNLADFVSRILKIGDDASQIESRAEILLEILSSQDQTAENRGYLPAPSLPFVEKYLGFDQQTSILTFLASLRAQGIQLWPEAGKLKFSAPPGVMTPDIKEAIAQKKPELLAILERSSLNASIEQVSTTEIMPLSFAQQRLFILFELDPTSPAYNLSRVFQIEGELNRDILKQSISAVIQRHVVLRSIFVLENGEAGLRMHPRPEFRLGHFDLRSQPETEKTKLAQEILQANVRQPFDLQSDMLICGFLIQMTDSRSLFQVVIHHIVTDLWSMNILFHEIQENYRGLVLGESVNLPDLSHQYVDYAAWQRSWLNEQKLADLLGYWGKKLKPPRATLVLPTDRPRSSVQSYNGSRCGFSIPHDLVSRIKEICQEKNTTPFMLLLAAFDILLYRYSGQTDILVGAPISNRSRVEFEELIGFFVNTLVVRADISGAQNFEHLLDQIKRTSIEAFEYQDLPFEKLVEALNPPRDRSQSPLFQVAFAFQNVPQSNFSLENLEVEPYALDRDISRFDWTLFLIELNTGLGGALEYNTDLFERTTIERAVRHYINILDQVIKHPQVSIDAIDYLTSEEKSFVLSGGNPSPEKFYPGKCLHELFLQQATSSPDAIAVVLDQGVNLTAPEANNFEQAISLTYAQLNSSAERLACRLRESGVKRGSFVGICTERSLEMIVGILGILKAGAAYVPLDPSIPQSRFDYILQDAQLSWVVTQNSLSQRICVPGIQNMILEHELAKVDPNLSEISQWVSGPDDPAYVIYTSGSTGVPKGVVVSHHQVVRLFQSTMKWFQFNRHEIWTMFHSYAFDFSVWEIWGALLHGGRLVIVPQQITRDPKAFVRLLCQKSGNQPEF